ncbi:DUF317 domain-containing protein [Streptomyces aurantiogriseus]|uniref:DUF317 domain-containing protein n=1 Tax=Streptomyces aurantiogriseus TaxID=66870 RepID=A0A918FG88_9ACTN|nr:DUF317 domain-containing protein [Streptomyces aurantiogriseus]GGR35860.1 hypothetical protein GCM10010251_60390 [Streptomyces aurantiogriseus]
MPKTPETVEVGFVAPRHLAGGGDPAWVTVPLHRACGWSYSHDPLMPRVILSSPDQKGLLRLEPAPERQWWNLQHAPEPDRPAWYASFGARTPVEIIAAVTDALTDPSYAPASETDPYEPLMMAGWTPAPDKDRLVSPDGKAHVEHYVSATSDCWWATTTLSETQGPVWQARFGEHAPPRLITAFTRALADPSPLPRTGSPLSIPAYGTKLITRTFRELPAAQVASALEGRVRSLAARRAAPQTNTPTPRRPPTGPGRTR